MKFKQKPQSMFPPIGLRGQLAISSPIWCPRAGTIVPDNWRENLRDSMHIGENLGTENNAWEFSYHHINHFQRQLEWELADLYFPRVMKNWQRFLKKDYKVYLNRFHKGQLVQNWLILPDTKGLIPIQPKAKLLGRGFWFCLPFILNLNCFPAFKGEFWYFVYSCVVVGDLIIFMENKWRALLASKPISGDGSGNSICQPGNLAECHLVRFPNFQEQVGWSTCPFKIISVPACLSPTKLGFVCVF